MLRQVEKVCSTPFALAKNATATRLRGDPRVRHHFCCASALATARPALREPATDRILRRQRARHAVLLVTLDRRARSSRGLPVVGRAPHARRLLRALACRRQSAAVAFARAAREHTVRWVASSSNTLTSGTSPRTPRTPASHGSANAPLTREHRAKPSSAARQRGLSRVGRSGVCVKQPSNLSDIGRAAVSRVSF